MGMNVEWKYLNGNCVEMIGLIGNVRNNWNCVEMCWKISHCINENNLELGRDEIYEMDVI